MSAGSGSDEEFAAEEAQADAGPAPRPSQELTEARRPGAATPRRFRPASRRRSESAPATPAHAL